VTSLTNEAASQRLTGAGETGGTEVKVLTTIGLAVGKESVAVGENWVTTACVDIPARVCAAAVYNAFRVAAGCGVEGANALQARVATVRAMIGIRSFLERVLCMNASGL
jgi:hypothetical protein